jgi:hypothetical protein
MPPERVVVLGDGTRVRIADLLRPGRGVLVALDGAGAAGLAGPWAHRVEVVEGTWGSCEGGPVEAVLVRPDGYVAWTSPGSARELTDVLAQWFGQPRAAVAAASTATERA